VNGERAARSDTAAPRRVEKQAVSFDHLDPATTAHLIRWEIHEPEQRKKGLT
jgi:hypothetical protein